LIPFTHFAILPHLYPYYLPVSMSLGFGGFGFLFYF